MVVAAGSTARLYELGRGILLLRCRSAAGVYAISGSNLALELLVQNANRGYQPAGIRIDNSPGRA